MDDDTQDQPRLLGFPVRIDPQVPPGKILIVPTWPYESDDQDQTTIRSSDS